MIGDLIKIQPAELPHKKGKRKKKPLYKRRWVHVLLILMVITGLGGWLGLQAYLKPFEEKAATFDLSQVAKQEQSTVILDRNGDEIGRLANENRLLIQYVDMPQHLIDALVATEDQRFWSHEGVDYVGVVRAAIKNFMANETKQGASTITQQLARNTYGLTEKTRERKILEMFLALRIEKHYTKSEILQHYLNRIPLGRGFYGVEAASLGYFSKHARDLTKSEAATLVGLIKSPTYFNPVKDMNAALRERNKVFDRMVAEKKLSESESDKLKKEPIELKLSDTSRAAGYAQGEVVEEVESILAGMGIVGITGKGYKIYTTVDSKLQKAAEHSLQLRLTQIEGSPVYPADREKMSGYTKKLAEWTVRSEALQVLQKGQEEKPGEKPAQSAGEKPVPTYLQGSVLAVDNRTGGVLAMVGGRDFGQSQFNRVLYSKRPAGTAFVPFVYAAAFEGTHFPGSRIKDERMDNTKVMMGATTGTLGEWGTEGTATEHEGMTSLRKALIQGKNNCTARLGLDIGVKRVVDFAKRAGLGDLPDDPSTLLGRPEVSQRDLTLAYTIFPNAGVKPADIWFVTRIERQDTTVIYERPKTGKVTEVTDSVAAWMTHSCLEDAIFTDIGTAAYARKVPGPTPGTMIGFDLGDLPVAGKTGTHITSTDLWFAGYNSEMTCTVWMGLDKPVPVYPDAFSRHTSLGVWVDVMKAAAAQKAFVDFKEPDGMHMVELCQVSGERATDACLELGPDPSNPERQKFFKCSYLEYIRPISKMEVPCTVHNKDDPAPATPHAVLPPVQAQGSPVDLASADARPLALNIPLVIGEDPYHSLAGGSINGTGTAADGPPPVVDSAGPPVIPAAAPVPNAGNSALLNPSPGKVTVD